MREMLYTALMVAGLLGLGVMASIPWETGLIIGAGVVLFGLLVGVPTGVVYHVQLYRVLAPKGGLPGGWYWRPLQFNAELTEAERQRVMPWCYAGGLGFVIIVLGIVALGVALLATYARLTPVS